MKRFLIVAMTFLMLGHARAAATVFECAFENAGGKIFLTIFDDGSPARIGVSQGVGNTGHAFYDKMTNSWGIVELNAGNMPVTLTSINSHGEAIHSRQLNGTDGGFIVPSQSAGSCIKNEIR